MIDYKEYIFSKREWIRNLLLSAGVTTMLSYVFYRSIVISILTLPCGYWVLKWRRQELKRQRDEKLNMEFKETIQSMSTAMNAGYSIENSLVEAVRDMKLLFGEESYMGKELEYMIQQIRLNRTIEEVFDEFSSRVELEDVHNFVDVVTTAKRTGGNVIKIIKSTSQSIGGKLEVRREIETLITAKKFEANIMCVVPLGIIVYMWISSPGYMDPLYHNLVGGFLMTVLLGCYLGAVFLAQRIMDIHV